MTTKTRSSKSITTTKNYRLFKISEENRALDLKKHKKLKRSLEKYGFLRSFPVVCVRNKNKALVVKDGQHRLAFAEELGLPVPYCVESKDFDIAVVNSTPKSWALIDYALKYSTAGDKEYEDGIEFANRHGLPIGTAFALLAGTTTFSNTSESFYSGKFRVKDRDWANVVASIYTAMVNKSREIRGARFMEACMAVCRVDGFNASRLLKNADRCRERLVRYSTRDAYLDLIEEVYNFSQRKLVPLKISAIQTMRERFHRTEKNKKVKKNNS